MTDFMGTLSLTNGCLQAERFVDRKLNQAEDNLKKGQKKAKSWYSGITGEDCHLKEIHIFIVSFVAGVAIGIGTS